MFTRKEYATSVSGKTANGCPVRSAKPPDNMDFDFFRPAGRTSTRFFDTLHGLMQRVFYFLRAVHSEQKIQKPAEQHTDCRRKQHSEQCPAGTAGFLSDGENGRAAWEVKERKDHHAQRGFHRPA